MDRIIPDSANVPDETGDGREIRRGAPLDDAIEPSEPLPGTTPTEDIVSQGRDED